MHLSESVRTAAFPAEPPASLTDSQTIAAHDWDAFTQLSAMTNHWDRPGWDPGHRRYYWFLTFEDCPELIRLVQQGQQALSHLALDPVPASGLHVTVARVGKTDQVSPEALDAVAKAARLRCNRVDPFRVKAIPMAGSRGAVRLSLAPWKPLLELHEAVTSACLDAGLNHFRPTSSFRPHLGVAYSSRVLEAEPVREAVAPLRVLRPVELNVRDAKLVELRRQDQTYRWDVVHSVRLGLPDPT